MYLFAESQLQTDLSAFTHTTAPANIQQYCLKLYQPSRHGSAQELPVGDDS